MMLQRCRRDVVLLSTTKAAIDIDEAKATIANQLEYPYAVVPNKSIDRNRSSSSSSHVHEDEQTSEEWVLVAAKNLERYGVCALIGSEKYNNNDTRRTTQDNNNGNNQNNSRESIIHHSICNRANQTASSRLSDLQQKIINRGDDPSGETGGPFRFIEVICRDEGGRRFDMPVPWIGSVEIGMPLSKEQTNAMTEFHECLDSIVRPVLNALWTKASKNEATSSLSIAAAGFLMNQPGSKSQSWHRDGPDEGYIDVFVPLVDLTEELGPTQLLPGTHDMKDVDSLNGIHEDELPSVTPLLQRGEILLFDYRTLHKGLGNTSDNKSRTLAYSVYTNQSSVDIHNFPDALTLEFD